MPRPRKEVPAYRPHKPRNQGKVVVADEVVYFPGRYNSPESLAAYRRWLAEYLATGHVRQQPSPTIGELVLAYSDQVVKPRFCRDGMQFYPKCYSREEAAAWIERQTRRYARHGHGLWLVEDKAAGQPIGQVGLLIQNIHGVEEKEVAYLIHRPFWRRGFATEAARACRDYAFDVLGRERVIALIRPENVPSQGVARKLGLLPEPDRVRHSGFEHIVFSVSRAAGKSA